MSSPTPPDAVVIPDVQVPDIDAEVEPVEVTEAEDGESSGTSSLPMARIKRILKYDPMYMTSSSTAVFSTAVATELFIQYFAEQAALVARADKRKKVQYKDLATAVLNVELLHFLADTVPRTAPLSELIRDNRIAIDKEDDDRLDDEADAVMEEGEVREEVSVPEGGREKPAKRVDLPKGQQTLSFLLKRGSVSDVLPVEVIDVEATTAEAGEAETPVAETEVEVETPVAETEIEVETPVAETEVEISPSVAETEVEISSSVAETEVEVTIGGEPETREEAGAVGEDLAKGETLEDDDDVIMT